ncbi:MAG: hypothetical protein ABR562_05135 [Thermoplasmatota archaeon]
MGIWTANVAVGAAVLLTGISLLLTIVGFVSFARLRNGRLLWVGLAFLGFAAQGATMAWWAYDRRAELAAAPGVPDLLVLASMGLAIVVGLYLAVLKR